MDIQIAGFSKGSIVDGKGIRYTIFMQGCPHNCTGCHNPETHDISGGQTMSTEDINNDLARQRMFTGITLSGGDPFMQPLEAKELADKCHALNKNVWCYTGYVYENIIDHGSAEMNALLDSIDVLVDGRFDMSCRTLSDAFKGSSNQRIIDVPQSRLTKKIVLLDI